MAFTFAGSLNPIDPNPFLSVLSLQTRPFSRSQLEAVVNIAGLEPTAWSRALYMPPHAAFAPYAEVIEQIGSRIAAPFSGVIMLEAVKQTFAVKPKGRRMPVRVFVPGALQPISSSRSKKIAPDR